MATPTMPQAMATPGPGTQALRSRELAVLLARHGQAMTRFVTRPGGSALLEIDLLLAAEKGEGWPRSDDSGADAAVLIVLVPAAYPEVEPTIFVIDRRGLVARSVLARLSRCAAEALARATATGSPAIVSTVERVMATARSTMAVPGALRLVARGGRPQETNLRAPGSVNAIALAPNSPARGTAAELRHAGKGATKRALADELLETPPPPHRCDQASTLSNTSTSLPASEEDLNEPSDLASAVTLSPDGPPAIWHRGAAALAAAPVPPPLPPMRGARAKPGSALPRSPSPGNSSGSSEESTSDGSSSDSDSSDSSESDSSSDGGDFAEEVWGITWQLQANIRRQLASRGRSGQQGHRGAGGAEAPTRHSRRQ